WNSLGFETIKETHMLRGKKTLKMLLGLGLAALSIVSSSAMAQSDKPIRLILGVQPGGATDIAARDLARSLTEQLGRTVVVENRVGASATIAANAVARAEPDGDTLGVFTFTHVVSPHIMPELPYDVLKDF